MIKTSTKSKVQSLKKLSSMLSKKKKKKVVFTNGCFDLIHPGHVEYLEQAKSKGDLLVVALNSDASVKRLKGESRPLNSLKDRMRVMASLQCVDFVTSFSEDTPLKIIKKIMPNVLVKGGDWKTEQIVGAKEVLDHGGKVYSLKFIDGKSTTSIIKKMK